MPNILVPFDGSDSALRAVRHAARLAKLIAGTQIELLHVLDPVLVGEHTVISTQDIRRIQDEEAARVLQPAREVLDAEGIPYMAHHRCGAPAGEIAQQVYESKCDAVVMGTRGLGPIASIMIGSVATRVIHLVDVPVTLIK
ncbi:universal stress protein [Noviherbaspirillum sp.]|uniref:universal stress protein n=1 Tax=Noviherbaspirillum sp. TaxID=1926288 RepID=UPI002D527C85|nr:universal stress protein [Noviherbaspirillum sp.]HZW22704.1 universal stress protein [Noviherbaspirillum sp.]